MRSGCAWRLLPHDLPPWRIVYDYFMVWRREGLWQKRHDTLRDQVRLRRGKKSPDPSCVVAQAVRLPRPPARPAGCAAHRLSRSARLSILKALKYLTTEECAAMMQARRYWDASDTFWWTRWV